MIRSGVGDDFGNESFLFLLWPLRLCLCFWFWFCCFWLFVLPLLSMEEKTTQDETAPKFVDFMSINVEETRNAFHHIRFWTVRMKFSTPIEAEYDFQALGNEREIRRTKFLSACCMEFE